MAVTPTDHRTACASLRERGRLRYVQTATKGNEAVAHLTAQRRS
jgi:hypothetical protein